MSSEGPTLYLKCVCNLRGAHARQWWTVGKLYHVIDSTVADDDDYPWREHVVAGGKADAVFTPIWLLPDGTELEALE